MATNKNITMKHFNGTDYDTLYPKTIASQIPDVYSKTDTITATTLSQLGLSANKLPNDAFQQIKTLVDNAQSSADSKARIQTGSYVGTGTYGANNPCSLTFDFEPKFLLFFQQNIIQNYPDAYPPVPRNDKVWSLITEGIWANNILYINYENARSEGYVVNKIVWGKTVTWYSVNLEQGVDGVIENNKNISAMSQFNISGTIYKYVAIG